ncbi:pyridoxamine 5'-phosphate oxidase family protein [Halorubrum kocurii]|nr:pyridoxamine 5'-phosphate oxidase family protein [Halorubrum kocurii]
MSIDAIAESTAASMSEGQMRELLEAEGVGTLGLPTGDLPYLIPVSFGFDGDATLYFVFLLFGTESRKETLVSEAGRGRFLVYRADSMYDWQSVSVTGPITAVEEGEWDELRSAMENAWHPNVFSSAHPMRGVRGYRFEIDEWTGLQQRDTGGN